MKKRLWILLTALGAVVIIVTVVLTAVLSSQQYSKDTLPPVTSDTDEPTPTAPLPSGVGMTLEEILRAEPYYDVNEALAEVNEWIQSMRSLYQEDPDSFSQYSGWVQYEIESIVPTHSQKTGFITGFVFEIVNENGERSYTFYDFETDTVVEHPYAASPFLLFGEEIENDPWLRTIVGEVKPENVFYFAHPKEGFDYGILQEDGSVVLYAANYYLNFGKEHLHWRRITIDDLWPDSETAA